MQNPWDDPMWTTSDEPMTCRTDSIPSPPSSGRAQHLRLRTLPLRGDRGWGCNDPALRYRPLCRLWLNGTKVTAFIDTGAQSCAVKKAVLEYLKRDPKVVPIDVNANGIAGQTIKIDEGLEGVVKLPDGYKFHQNLLVMPLIDSFPGEVLVGQSLLRRFNYRIVSYTSPRERHYLTLDGHKVPVFYDPSVCMRTRPRYYRPGEFEHSNSDGQSSTSGTAGYETAQEAGMEVEDNGSPQVLRAMHQFTVWPYTKARIRTKPVNHEMGLIMVTDYGSDVYATTALYDYYSRGTNIWVRNTTGEPVTIPEGTPLAYATAGVKIVKEVSELHVLTPLEVDGELDPSEVVRLLVMDEPTDLEEKEKRPEGETGPYNHLTTEQAAQVEEVLARFTPLFDEDGPLGVVPGVQHCIRMEKDVNP